MTPSPPAAPGRPITAADWRLVGALALGPAVSLGLARFSYALLVPPMREDLGWSYLTAGAMNTVNAAGYFAGALAVPMLLARRAANVWFIVGFVLSAIALAAHGAVTSTPWLYAIRFFTGAGSAITFVCGALIAARLARPRPGLALGMYYGGTGLGIVASALVIPPLAARGVAHAWQAAWIGLGVIALVAAAVAWPVLRGRADAPMATAGASAFPRRRYLAGLASYFGFGLGYIGYMTFVVTLLREAGLGAEAIVAFYALLGLAVIASSWLWAWLLQRAAGGGALALLNGLLALAVLLPVVSATPWAAFASGLLFGSVFLSVVASTTALVRRNAPPAQWASGIAEFAAVFAAGQIVGPSLVGALSDAVGGLRAGFAASAAVLALAAIVAMAQRPVVDDPR